MLERLIQAAKDKSEEDAIALVTELDNMETGEMVSILRQFKNIQDDSEKYRDCAATYIDFIALLPNKDIFRKAIAWIGENEPDNQING